jgi:hypothetical protein
MKGASQSRTRIAAPVVPAARARGHAARHRHRVERQQPLEAAVQRPQLVGVVVRREPGGAAEPLG